jgi:hypothetical protein
LVWHYSAFTIGNFLLSPIIFATVIPPPGLVNRGSLSYIRLGRMMEQILVTPIGIYERDRERELIISGFLGVLHIELFFLQKSEPSDDNVKAKYI